MRIGKASSLLLHVVIGLTPSAAFLPCLPLSVHDILDRTQRFQIFKISVLLLHVELMI